ncbi:hypothetical protein ABT288_31695 [Streptomyces sp. NPDC001093]|uniref:hypothetical protein n=1 Tax=Streptomyces sp. NPDC001093 TaxID=3154376 RepID=UPI003329AAA7
MAASTGVTPEWIERETGVVERRYAEDDQAASDLAAEAGPHALENAGVRPTELTWIIVAFSTPDQTNPLSPPWFSVCSAPTVPPPST